MRSAHRFLLLGLIALAGLTHRPLLPNAATGTMGFATITANTTAANVGPCPTSFTVNSLSDFGDSTPGDGVCSGCTLRAAIEEANALRLTCSPLTINIAYSSPSPVTIYLDTPLPALDHPNLTINGPGARLMAVERRYLASGIAAFRILTINSGKQVNISGLRLSQGDAGNANGGGILNAGNLTLTNCTISLNRAPAGNGGGIYNDAGAVLTAVGSAIANNYAGLDRGGGIWTQGAQVMLTNCTVSRNAAELTGGGIYQAAGTVEMASCTLSHNYAYAGGGGGVFGATSAALTISNTIVADNIIAPDSQGPDLFLNTPVTSQGHNLIGKTDGSTGWIASDQTGTVAAPLNARLGELDDYGGTPTRALRCDSPAIDAGNTALATDQRGLPRPADGDGDNTSVVDIGAFEVQKHIVTTTADSGTGSLRQALTDNNLMGGALIVFNIPGAGVQTIAPASALPALFKTVNIDGYSQPGARPNTLATGSNAVLLIELTGVNIPVSPSIFTNAFTIEGSHCCARGLVINKFSGNGLKLGLLASRNWINGNHIGTDAAGAAALGNGSGIFAFASHAAATENLIGGRTPGARNVISGNKGTGITFSADPGGYSANRVEGNYIGTDAQGTAALGNKLGGVYIASTLGNVIGGTAAGTGNLIAFNDRDGVAILLHDFPPYNNSILGNSIFANAGLGINLAPTIADGVTPNDSGDGDGGPNNLQNFPLLSSVASDGSNTTFTGTLNSTANRTFIIQFFANAACDSSGHGEGQYFLNQTTVTTDDSGNVAINATLSAAVAGGSFVTATATDADGNTSEFSACITASGPACNYVITPTSQSFAANGGNGSFSVTPINGCAWTATSNDPSWITITQGSSGSGNETVSYTVAAHNSPTPRSGTITITGGLTFTVWQGAQFNDVPTTHSFYTEIGKLSARGITLGCGDGNFCPDANVTRAQMAALLSRALGVFSPPVPGAQRFADVPSDHIFYDFIEEVAVRQITLGCGGGNYCPTNNVTREQMAAFLIRALHEPGYVPPAPATQRFLDVSPAHLFYAHIEELAARGITLGCGGGNYCPTDFVTRAQMAAFLVRAFRL